MNKFIVKPNKSVKEIIEGRKLPYFRNSFKPDNFNRVAKMIEKEREDLIYKIANERMANNYNISHFD